MENCLKILACSLIIVESSKDLVHPLLKSPCGGGWRPYLHETCFKFVDSAGTQTKDDADIVCQRLAGELEEDDIPKLVTVKTKEKQEFIQSFLFANRTTSPNNVWLGLDMIKDGVFHWNDGTKLSHSNWADDNQTNSDRNCVQMEAGRGVHDAGKWSRVYCRKKNAVVCERVQPWFATDLQSTLVSLMLEIEENQKEADDKIRVLKQQIDAGKVKSETAVNAAKKESETKVNAAIQELNRVKQEFENKMTALKKEANSQLAVVGNQVEALKQNPVPVGYLYIQLPGKQPPTILWPQLKWKDVSAEYAGLFFRTVGGDAAQFGQVQEDNTRRLDQVSVDYGEGENVDPIVLPNDGTWSKFRWIAATSGRHRQMRWRLTAGEVRPRNKAVKIWQRT